MLKDQHFINRITTGISKGFNHPKAPVTQNSVCYHCKSDNIEYDEDRDELTCLDCGYVQRQALKDYSDNIGKYQMTSQEHKARTKLEEFKNHNNGVGAKP